MFTGATAWLAKFVRVDGSGSVAGPPSVWQFRPLTQGAFSQAITDCLATHPVAGLCVDSEYGPMPGWDVSAVTDMSKAFRFKSDFNADINGWDTSSVNNMGDMFWDAAAFNQPIGDWITASVTNMNNMFHKAAAFHQPIGDWNTASVTNMGYMFVGAAAFAQDITGWSTPALTNRWGMFSRATAWLAKCVRVDGSGSVDGPPSVWQFPPLTQSSFQAAVTACLETHHGGWTVRCWRVRLDAGLGRVGGH